MGAIQDGPSEHFLRYRETYVGRSGIQYWGGFPVKGMKLWWLWLLIVVASFAGSTFAGPTIDFRHTDWSGAEGRQSHTAGNVSADVNPYSDNDYYLVWDPVDGLGLYNEEPWTGAPGGPDKIDWRQR